MRPTHIYAAAIRALFEANVEISYMANITGHGWRKLMRANQSLSYVMHDAPVPDPLFNFIQEHSGNDDQEMYGNFNMSAGFAVFLKPNQAGLAKRTVLEASGRRSLVAGEVQEGPKQVVIEPKNLVFTDDTLSVR